MSKRKPIREKHISWQRSVKTAGEDVEKSFNAFFAHKFQKGKENAYEIIKNPNDFSKLYSTTPKQGIKPEFLIRNNENNKGIIVELKRQGVNNGGNAHERACRYFMKGMEEPLKSICNLDVLPVWIVYTNGIARDEKRIREINFWFNGMNKYHYCFWGQIDSFNEIEEHFDRHIKPILE